MYENFKNKVLNNCKMKKKEKKTWEKQNIRKYTKEEREKIKQ